MNLQVVHETDGAGGAALRPLDYQMMTLGDLAWRIAENADDSALAELHRRTPFRFYGSGPVCFIEFIDLLRRQAVERVDAYADEAYDLVVDRFSRLAAARPGAEDAMPLAEDSGIDCRRYFAALVEHLDRNREALGGVSPLEQEMFEAKALQGLVWRHFALALRECHRTAFMNRYVWRLPDGHLTVLMPRSIPGRARKEWLEENITEVDPNRPNEAARVQEIIDAWVGQTQLLVAVGDPVTSAGVPWISTPTAPTDLPVSISVDDLANTVAEEKAATIHRQRPAIRALGPKRLAAMIRQIFEGLAEEQYCLVRVAGEYGLSKASLSRFAGIRWHSGPTPTSTQVPDLWRNTAQVIGHDPDLVEAAKCAGVWPQVELAAGSCVTTISQDKASL